jgi:hypothetical protein
MRLDSYMKKSPCKSSQLPPLTASLVAYSKAEIEQLWQ